MCIYLYTYIVIGKTPIPLAAPPLCAFSQALQLQDAKRTFQVDGLDSALQMAYQAKLEAPWPMQMDVHVLPKAQNGTSTVESLPTLTLEN